jgi:transcriptional regulator with XRE-family HTH domain
MTEPSFKRWRKQLGWTQIQAAEALGVTVGYVKSLDSGISRTTKQPVKMSETLRMLMTAIAERGGKIEPWPEG